MPAAAESPLKRALLHHITYSLGTTVEQLAPRERFLAVALAVRDQMIDGLLETEQRCRMRPTAKRLYYLSMEFLIGRSLSNNLVNLGLLDEARERARRTRAESRRGGGQRGRRGAGQRRPGPAGGLLPRLAGDARPARLRLRHQLRIRPVPPGDPQRRTGRKARQLAHLRHALDRSSGRRKPSRCRSTAGSSTPPTARATTTRCGSTGRSSSACRTTFSIAGYGGRTVNYLRLFAARASQEVDMGIFNDGDYLNAVQQKVLTETISKVLYPSADSAGRPGAAADAGVLPRRLRRPRHRPPATCASTTTFDNFPDKVAIQLNDTHPTLAIAELMRLLVDEHDLDWDEAWEITQATFAYTNHTLMPEALEKWPVDSARAACCRGTCRSSTRSITRFLKQVGRTLARRRGAAAADVADRGERRQAGAHGEPGHRRQPFGQRRGGAAQRTGQDRAGARLRPALARNASTTRPTASRRGAGCWRRTRGWRR